MSDPSRRSPEDEAAMRDRLAALGRDLAKGGDPRQGQSPQPPTVAGMGQALNMGVRVMSEFVAAVAVGGFIGWLIDRGLGTSPFGLIVFIGLGTAAGFWSVYRVAMGTTGRR